MNPNQCRVALRPRGPLEVLDLQAVLWRSQGGIFAKLLALTVTPFAIVGAMLCWALDGHVAILLLPWVAGPVLQAPFTVLAGHLLFADSVPLKRVFADVFARAPLLLGAWLVEGLGWVISIASCGYGAFVIQPACLYLTETALLERVGSGRGLRRSLRLAGGHVGIALVGAASRWVFMVWCGLVGEATGQAVVGTILQLGEPFGSLMNGQVTPYLILGLLLSQPIHAVYRLLLYVDVRTRIEGWDLQVGLRAAGLER